MSDNVAGNGPNEVKHPFTDSKPLVRDVEASTKGPLLVPAPTDHIDDPLNWSYWRKSVQLATIIFLSFTQIAACVGNILAFVVQAKSYDVPAIDMTYTASAYLGGLIAGPVLLAPLALKVGRPFLLFWCCIGQIACQIWSAKMTMSDDYIPFLISRLFVGLFGCLPPAFSPAFIMEVFYLHQRGRVFALWEIIFLFGTLAPTTISGFIVENLYWTWTLWWTVPPLGLAAVLCFLFLEETNFDRQNMIAHRPNKGSWIQDRLITIFMGWKIVPQRSFAEVANAAIRPLAIGIAPISVGPGLFSLLAFGFAVMVTLLMSLYLQTPVEEGGYGFTPTQNAYFSFTAWLAAACAWITGHLAGDRLPLFLAKKFSRGAWHPEYRLANLIIPAIMSPIGLGIFGATLQYHLQVEVLALGYFFVSWAALLCVPVNINYVCECFVEYPLEVGVAFNIWRNILGLALPFFTGPWELRVGAGWEFGMAAFFVLLSGVLTGVVAICGSTIRKSSYMVGFWKAHSEDGALVRAVSP